MSDLDFWNTPILIFQCPDEKLGKFEVTRFRCRCRNRFIALATFAIREMKHMILGKSLQIQMHF